MYVCMYVCMQTTASQVCYVGGAARGRGALHRDPRHPGACFLLPHRYCMYVCMYVCMYDLSVLYVSINVCYE